MRPTLSLVFSILFAFLLGSCETPRQRLVTSIRTSLKAKRYAEALRQIETARKDTLLNRYPKLYHLGMESSQRMYDKENEKHYLKRGADTLALFRSLYNIYDYALLVDSIEQQVAGASSAASYRKDLAESMNALFPNLNAASLHFLRKQDWKEAARYADLGLRARQSPIFQVQAPKLADSLRTQWAWRHLLASFQGKQYRQVLKYAPQALKSEPHRAISLEMLAKTQLLLGDTVAHVAYLKRGVGEFPQQDFFLITLSDHYFLRHQPDSVLQLIQELSSTAATPLLLKEECARAYYMKKDYQHCQQAAEAMIALDKNYAQGYYYLGYSALQQAKGIEMPLSISAAGYRSAYQRQHKHYKKAQQSLETYRRLAPQQSTTWAPLLYEVYLKLNLGEEFEEISRHLPQ